MAASGLSDRIEGLISPSLVAMGYQVVRVQMAAGDPQVLQIMAERVDRRAMTVAHCTEISRTVSALLEVEDPVAGAYSLEVSSPGIDRPLVREEDFERFVGYEAKIETKVTIDGRRRFRGRLLSTGKGGVRIAIGGAEVDLPFEAIARAKLVLTDELLDGKLES